MTLKIAWLWPALVVFELFFLLGIYGQLPLVVASHFDASGNPTAFMGKQAFLSSFLLAIGFLNGLIGLFYLLVPHISPERMNLPNKAIWLSISENRALLSGKLRSVMAIIALFANTAFLFALQVIYQQNVPGVWKLPISGGLVGLAALTGCLVLFLSVILRPPKS